MPYDLTYKRDLMNKTTKQSRTRFMEKRNRMTVTRGEEESRRWWKEWDRTSQGTCVKYP